MEARMLCINSQRTPALPVRLVWVRVCIFKVIIQEDGRNPPPPSDTMSSKALFPIPAGGVANVSIVDTTVRMRKLPASMFLSPSPVPGLPEMPTAVAWSFLVENPATGRKVVFDLGVPKDQQAGIAPAILKQVASVNAEVDVEKDVADVLRDGGVDPKDIESVIWR